MELENWRLKLIEKLVLSGTDELESVVDESVLKYLLKYNQESIKDPYKLAQAIVDLYGPSVIEIDKVRRLIFKNLEVLALRAFAESDSETMPETVDRLVRQGWKWGTVYVNSMIEKLGIEDILEAYKMSLTEEEVRVLPDECSKLGSVDGFYELHSFQAQIKEDTLNNFKNGDRKVLVRLPTGGGKTRVAVHTLTKLISQSNQSGPKRFLWLTYSPLLASQACETFLDVYKVIGKDSVRVSKIFYGYNQFEALDNQREVLFANVTSLSKKFSSAKELQEFAEDVDCIVFDEVHQVKAPIAFSFITKLLKLNEEIKFLGLTATPGRGDLSGGDTDALIHFFDSLVEIKIPPVEQAFGDISKIEGVERGRSAVSYLQDLGVLAKLNEERLSYDEKKDIHADKDPDRNKLIIDSLKFRIDTFNNKVVVFANSAEHARLLSILVKSEGYEVGLILGENKVYRDQLIKKFRKGNLNILITYEVLTTGFDAPEIDCLIVSRPTGSIVTYSQILGRALRGKLNGGHEENYIINISDPAFGDVNQVYKEFNEYWSKK